jgi:tetratricopeptide (TPR) repeat protein
MFALKPLSPDRIPAALEKAERYRLLNEPVDAESICRDILQVAPDHHHAQIALLLSLTDQFSDGRTDQFDEAKEIAARLPDEYQRSYYLGIVYERRAKARYRSGGHGSGPVAYGWFTKAMECFERAAALRPPDDDEAVLRFNTCARFLAQHPDIKPAVETYDPVELE